LRADVARLKTNAPSQSHTMSDVGYHWTNLWFAAEKKNWPLDFRTGATWAAVGSATILASSCSQS
jgi:hypothetical protein